MHVLLVAYRFPPQSGGGVIRPLKFAKYLSRLGHQITVVTAEPAPGKPLDPSLRRDLPPEVRVIQVRERRILPDPPPRRTSAVSAGVRLADRLRVGLRWGMFQCMVPDDRAGFIVPAAEACAHGGRWAGPGPAPDIVLATGGPWSCFVAGGRIARELRLPLVLDYRDPWTTYFEGLEPGAGALARRRNRGLERDLVRRCDAVVSAHRTIPALLEDRLRLPGVTRRCHWIPNGYDPEDFIGISPRGENGFSITFAGSLYGTRTLGPVVPVLEELTRDGRMDREKLRLRILGPSPENIRRQFSGSPLQDRIETPGFLPHAETLSCLEGSTVNLVVDIVYEGPNIHVPGKLYEYLRAGRPILALSRPGETEDLIREAEGGWVVRPEDRESLRDVLGRAYQDWAQGRPLPRPRQDVAEQYDRARSTGRLAVILENCVQARRASG